MLPTTSNSSYTSQPGGMYSSSTAMFLPSLCVLLEMDLDTPAATAAGATASGPALHGGSGGAWTGAAAASVSDVLFYAYPTSLALAIMAALLGLCVFVKMAATSHECYVAAFYAAAITRLLTNVAQVVPVYLLNWQADVTAARVGAALSSVASHLAAADYWLRMACTWLLVIVAAQRALSSLCHCGAVKSDEEQLWSSRGDRFRGSMAAFLVCCFTLVFALPQFWMHEALGHGGGIGGGAAGERRQPPQQSGSRAGVSESPAEATVFDRSSSPCARTGALMRSAGTLTPEFLAYDWCALFVRFCLPYVLLPILLPALARGDDEKLQQRRRRRQQQQAMTTTPMTPTLSPALPQAGGQAKYQETALLRMVAKEERDFDRLLLLTALLYLLLAAPTNVVRTLVDRPVHGTAVLLDHRLAGLIYVMADVLFNLFFAIAFVLHLLCSTSFRRTFKRLCCCCRCSARRHCCCPPSTRAPSRSPDYDE